MPNPVFQILGFVALILLVVGAASAIWMVWSFASGRRLRATEEEHEEDYQRQICATCGYDLRSSVARCPECSTPFIDRKKYRAALGSDWPANPITPRTPEVGETLEVLLSTEDSQEAGLLQQQLISRGFAASIRKTKLAGEHVPGRSRHTYIEVLVYCGDIDGARAYLRRIQGLEQELSRAMKVDDPAS